MKLETKERAGLIAMLALLLVCASLLLAVLGMPELFTAPAEPEPAPPPARPAAKRPPRPNSARRRQEHPKRRAEPPDRRFAGSLPVKKGKGSRKPSGKTRQQ